MDNLAKVLSFAFWTGILLTVATGAKVFGCDAEFGQLSKIKHKIWFFCILFGAALSHSVPLTTKQVLISTGVLAVSGCAIKTF